MFFLGRLCCVIAYYEYPNLFLCGHDDPLDYGNNRRIIVSYIGTIYDISTDYTHKVSLEKHAGADKSIPLSASNS